MADIVVRYPLHLHVMHQPGATGDRSTTAVLMILPTREAPGVNAGALSESVALRGGSYTQFQCQRHGSMPPNN
eukprot:11215427-Lingulodinium_polyedra.AAC.1